MNENRGPWYLITGLVLGLILGLAVAWFFRPPQLADTSPASLRSEYKDQYRQMIASAYQANGDLVRARARLELLNEAEPYRLLAEQAQSLQSTRPEHAQALAALAGAIGQEAPGAQVIQPSPTPFATVVFTPTLVISPQP